MSVVVKMDNALFEGLQADLAKLEPKVQKKLTKKSLREAGKRTAKVARVSSPVLTGNLRKRGIIVRAIRAKSGRIGVHVRFSTRERLSIPPEAKGFYPAILEYGVPSRGIRPYGMLRKAFDQTESSNFRMIRRDMAKLIYDELRGA